MKIFDIQIFQARAQNFWIFQATGRILTRKFLVIGREHYGNFLNFRKIRKDHFGHKDH